MVPKMRPSHRVKIPRKMKLMGNFLLTSEQQAREMMQTRETTRLE